MADDIDALLDEAENLVSRKSCPKPSKTRDMQRKAPTPSITDTEIDDLMNELSEECGDQVRHIFF